MSIPSDGLIVIAYVQKRAMTLWIWSWASARSIPNSVFLTSRTARATYTAFEPRNRNASAPYQHAVNLAAERALDSLNEARDNLKLQLWRNHHPQG